jgi:hypothetical protein
MIFSIPALNACRFERALALDPKTLASMQVYSAAVVRVEAKHTYFTLVDARRA